MSAYTGFNLSGLIDVDYVNQTRDEIVSRMLNEGVTMSIVDVIPNVKNVMTLNGLVNTITVQGDACGFDPAGDVALTQKELRVNKFKINDLLCDQDLESTYLADLSRAVGGNFNDPEIVSAAFTNLIIDSYANQVANFNEHYIWDGDGAGVDGLVKEIDDDTDVVNAASAVASASGYIAKLQALLSAAPTELRTARDGVVFCTFNFFDGYMAELRAANNYMLANTEYATNGYITKIPGTNIMLVACMGLSDLTNNTVATGTPLVYTKEKNIVIGTDFMTDERATVLMGRDEKEQSHYVVVRWKLGQTFRWAKDIVKGYTLA